MPLPLAGQARDIIDADRNQYQVGLLTGIKPGYRASEVTDVCSISGLQLPFDTATPFGGQRSCKLLASRAIAKTPIARSRRQR